MPTLDEMVAQRKRLRDELAAVDEQIREHTDLPEGWEIDPGNGLMAGGVTLHHPGSYDGDAVSICVYGGAQGSGFFIKDEGDTSAHVDPEAVRAALRIYDLKEAARRKARMK